MIRAVWILVLLVPAGAGAQTLFDHYTAGMQARAAGDFDTYRAEFEAAEEIEPGHAVLEFHLARACAGAGDPDAALQWLDRALRQGAWIDVAGDEWLTPLHATDGWPAALALADSVGSYHGEGSVGFELDEFDLRPEGIEHDPVTGDFFLGSVKRKILRIDTDGVSANFVAAGSDGLLAVLGLRVDAERRRLWAVSIGDDNLVEIPEADQGATRLHCWSLDDGGLLGAWDAPADSVDHGFNDVDLLPDGSAVVTDASAGALYRVAVGDEEFTQVVAPKTLRGPNGIAVNEAGTHAWVAEYVYGVARVDLRDGTVAPLKVPDGIALIGVDGLYHRDGELFAVQNYAGLNRAAAFRLNADGTAVESVRVLEARHPRVADPTTGVIVGDEFWYIVNSNIAGYNRHRENPEPATLGTVLIQRVEI